MRAYRILAGARQDALQRIEHQVSGPTGREVRVRVRAVSLNYRDLMITWGSYPISTERPPIAGADCAGEVIALGPGVTRFKIGEHVAIPYFPDWVDGEPTAEKLHRVPGASIDGVLAEEIVVSEELLITVPSWLPFTEAATLPCAGVTAWNALFVAGRAKPGNTVLLLGTGGVSIWALQLAKAAGLRTIITSSSDEKLARARSLGADHTINYRNTPEWQDEVLGITSGRGVDVAVEVGGDGTLGRSIAATRAGGMIAVVGGVSGFATKLEIVPLLLRSTRLTGIMVGSRAMFEDLNRFVTTARIRPTIDRVFSFDETREAYGYLESGKHFGKVVIRLDEGVN
ncbi:MAG: zinc-dependent alcohol dehydrogenase family protein [Steroidobacteraceae bacterium]